MSNDDLDMQDMFVFDISRPIVKEEDRAMNNNCECRWCVYLDTHTCLPDSGAHRCKLSRSFNTLVTDSCKFNRVSMPVDAAIKVLHDMQKWRRGGKGDMVHPCLFGIAIDAAIRHLRQINKD